MHVVIAVIFKRQRRTVIAQDSRDIGGVLFDAAGYSFDVTRAQQRAVVMLQGSCQRLLCARAHAVKAGQHVQPVGQIHDVHRIEADQTRGHIVGTADLRRRGRERPPCDTREGGARERGFDRSRYSLQCGQKASWTAT